MKRRILRCIKIALIFLLCVTTFSTGLVGSAEKLSDRYPSIQMSEAAETRLPYYADYSDDSVNAGFIPASEEIPLLLENGTLSDGGTPKTDVLQGKNCVVTEEDQSLLLPFSVSADGLYEIEIEYYIMDALALPVRRSILLDGKLCFSEAQSMAFNPYFQQDKNPSFSENGNQLETTPVMIEQWNSVRLYAGDGSNVIPLKWAISAGEHTLELQYVDRPAAISSIKLCTSENIPSYDEVKKIYVKEGYREAQESRLFQAESPNVIAYQTDGSIMPFSDSDPKTTPTSLKPKVFNAIGGNTWANGGQELAFTLDVPKTGLYKLSLRISQKWQSNMPSCRRIAIDGQVPFSELLAYSFSYNRQWYTETLSQTDGNPFLFYLEEGEHTLSFTPVQDPSVARAIRSLELSNDDLSAIYRRILLITGPEPDLNYEYELEISIPELITTFNQIIEKLDLIRTDLKNSTDGKSEADSQIKMISRQLTDMRDNPKTIAWKLGDLSNAMSSIGSLSSSLRRTPLALDFIDLSPPSAKIDNGKSGLLSRIWVSICSFFYSFEKDMTPKKEEQKSISVWVSRGKEWSVIMNDLIRSDFEVKSGIKVDLNVLPSGSLSGTVNPLLLALTSGLGPDAVINMDASLPVEYGIRGAAAELSQMPDYSEIASRFHPEILKSFTYLDKVYALPEAMNFYVLMYRKDIFNNLGLSVPKTWNDVDYHLLPTLYQNNMQMMPAPFDLYLYQTGGTYYSGDGLYTGLNTPQAHTAFARYINQFHDLGFPISADFFNRFRTGEMPIGFADYPTYLQMVTAAPELLSKWELAPVPGTVQEDGSINNCTTPLALSSNMLMKSAKSPDEAWEFLKWWSEAEVQAAYGKRLENTLGSGARWNPAVLGAYDSLPWSKSDLAAIRECWNNTKVIPEVLGGVISARALNNAGFSALYEGMTPRQALERAADETDKELLRKQELYGIYRGKERE